MARCVTNTADIRESRLEHRVPQDRGVDKLRNKQIRILRARGLTYREIGELFRLSPERCHQICQGRRR